MWRSCTKSRKVNGRSVPTLQAVSSVPKPPPMVEAALHAAAARGVPHLLLWSLAYHQSAYDPRAYDEKTGAAGLMHLYPAVAAALDVNPFDPMQAADAAALLLVNYRVKYRGSWAHALAAYAWGPGNVERSGPFGSANWPAPISQWVSRVLEGAGMGIPFELPIFMVPPGGMHA